MRFRLKVSKADGVGSAGEGVGWYGCRFEGYVLLCGLLDRVGY